MFNLCSPALIYVAFSITQIVIDTFKGLYNQSLIKLFVMVMITILLNSLCESGMGVVSWIIVFIPFIMMSIISSVLLYIFGLNASTGTFNAETNENARANINTNTNTNTNSIKNINVNNNGDIVIYDPYYDSKNNPVYYKSPNIIIPTPKGARQPRQKIQYSNSDNVSTATNVTTFKVPSLINTFNSSGGEFRWV
jgi:hypothetical protein